MSNPEPRQQEPRFELRHRMARSLEAAQLTNDDMADHLGRSTTTIRNYLSGRTHPDRSTVRDWAMRCGVPLDWLTDGGRDLPGRCIGWLSHVAA